jgi:hypothetical protein
VQFPPKFKFMMSRHVQFKTCFFFFFFFVRSIPTLIIFLTHTTKKKKNLCKQVIALEMQIGGLCKRNFDLATQLAVRRAVANHASCLGQNPDSVMIVSVSDETALHADEVTLELELEPSCLNEFFKNSEDLDRLHERVQQITKWLVDKEGRDDVKWVKFGPKSRRMNLARVGWLQIKVTLLLRFFCKCYDD